MKKEEFISKMSQKANLTKKETEAAFKAFTETLQETLVAGDSVSFIGFGTFGVAERAAREGRNPRTGETMKIPASRTITFKVGKSLKEAVNK